jgi:hypothetical protein
MADEEEAAEEKSVKSASYRSEKHLKSLSFTQ